MNNENIAYTFIIPHYNIPKLLIRCINSIPVREDVQVIVVDDCSPDADKYLGRYSELHRPSLEFYSTPKGGSAGRARNIGLAHAKGKWIIFSDADDLFVENVDEILDKYKDCEYEVVTFNTKGVVSDDLSVASEKCNYASKMIERYVQTGDDFELRYLSPFLWGKMIKREFIEKYNIRCDETRYANDRYFVTCVSLYSQSFYVDTQTLNLWVERNNSLDGQRKEKSYKEWNERFEVAYKCKKLLLNNGIEIGYYRDTELLEELKSQNKARFYLKLLTKVWDIEYVLKALHYQFSSDHPVLIQTVKKLCHR